jgi:Protein of unknown function (DUF4038)/Domain of unknown function (DUF5060)/Putative collagen-binding domain of a collagenase
MGFSRRRVKRICSLALLCFLPWGCVAISPKDYDVLRYEVHDVPRYGIFEQSFTQSGSYGNPYTDVTATATFIQPDGARRSIPLFWDGGTKWKVRFSPDVVGGWSWSVSSSDLGLNGANGSFNCVPSSNRGGIMPMSGYPYHFQYQDGTPYWLFGDTQWEAFADDPGQNLTHDSMIHYFDIRSSQGFNYMHSELFGHVRASNGGSDGKLNPAFYDYKAETINPAYFQECDFRITYANARGMAIGIIPAEGHSNPGPLWVEGTMSWQAFPNEAARLRFARYVVARYSAYNVAFIVTTEWNGGTPYTWEAMNSVGALFDAIGWEMSKNDPHKRMLGIHETQWQTNQAWFYGDPYGKWTTFGDYKQQYGYLEGTKEATPDSRRELHSALLRPRFGDPNNPNKPAINGEYAYYLRDSDQDGIVDKQNSHNRKDFRRASWVLSMAGGYFVTGFASTYYGGWLGRGVAFDPDDPRNDIVIGDLQRLKNFFTSLPWWRLDPHDKLVTANYGYSVADIGRTYVVYAEASNAVSLDLGGASAGTYSVTLYDPRIGSYTSLPDYTGSGPVTLTPPDTQDWIFVVTLGGTHMGSSSLTTSSTSVSAADITP